MIWAYSYYARTYGKKEYLSMAKQGLDFLSAISGMRNTTAGTGKPPGGDNSGSCDKICRKPVDHGLKYGFDWRRGGVCREGPHEGEPLVRDKEWWQNCESLVAMPDIYAQTGEENCFRAFQKNWEFDSTYMIHHAVGEWYQLLTEKEEVLVSQIGNPWKAMYHTGRAMPECVLRLGKLCEKEK